MQWFAVGLGLPLVGIALLLSQDDVVSVEPAHVAETPDTVISVDPIDEIDLAEAPKPNIAAAGKPDTVAFHPPLALPETAFDLLTFTISRGDTLDSLFRKNKLSLSHLAQIIRLPEARNYLRLLKPGDEFEIRHDAGSLISLYRELSLTRALRVSKGD
jgi:cell envelope opacity-associated protein A